MIQNPRLPKSNVRDWACYSSAAFTAREDTAIMPVNLAGGADSHVIRSAANNWWLRSPGGSSPLSPDQTFAAAVKSTGNIYSYSIQNNLVCARTAPQMYGMYSTDAQKLTILDSSLSAGTASATAEEGSASEATIKVSSTGATPNHCFPQSSPAAVTAVQL